MWFKELTGFYETTAEEVRQKLSVKGEILKSHVNDREFRCGRLEILTLCELREKVASCQTPVGKLSLNEVVADVQQLHQRESNKGALFQVASQFNLLEMVSYNVNPEQGVGIYETDNTQGPACAIAAGAGTIYRNYFARVNGSLGQTEHNQIDCLKQLAYALGNSSGELWEMKNGYALATGAGLREIRRKILDLSNGQLHSLKGKLSIGIQWNTEVTLNNSQQLVSQAFCSALPVAYSRHPSTDWMAFATLVLQASYEAVICAGILNYLQTGNNRIYLTLIGGGAFGNDIDWIIRAIRRALSLYQDVGLDVVVVSHSRSNRHVQELISEF
ncbi:hypothetical protein MNBD_GAMMA12-2744 [hydrothermal vent metagenome]|uniref:Microbial-type PARG catalytic domain-containing protein n=1 Tax=hydrothermal vent metagenome TaxID=652676 RepID=A0A3B0YCP5_9ZZZZ